MKEKRDLVLLARERCLPCMSLVVGGDSSLSCINWSGEPSNQPIRDQGAQPLINREEGRGGGVRRKGRGRLELRGRGRGDAATLL